MSFRTLVTSINPSAMVVVITGIVFLVAAVVLPYTAAACLRDPAMIPTLYGGGVFLLAFGAEMEYVFRS